MIHRAGAVALAEKPNKGRRDIYLTIGAILTIIAGALSLTNGIEGLLTGIDVLSFLPTAQGSVIPVCAVLLIIFGVVAIAGGLYGLRPRARVTPVLIGAALGMLGGGELGFFLGLAAILIFWLANVDL